MSNPRLVIGISGSSGIVYGIRLLEALKEMEVETHLVVSKAAQLTRGYETNLTAKDLNSLADVVHACQDIAAPIASGSFKTLGMIIAPCSMKTLGEIAHGTGSSLLARAADVTLKERRRLVIMPREAPLHLVHLQNMVTITQMGGIVFPPVPAFYNEPQTIADLVNDNIGRVLDLFGLDNTLARRWDQ
ncbi:UbiX family flavin prenyltransferase [Legionella londiniensis]|uniref:Flavin prenyltransferase UbiX n=1 Tax=Legionella londiniensis TaxID=45068 RepID=A0A0W0VID7_9GAMM|nr:UbiX family flavin prenyltransferase [Legionella londiniensis]KTD19888.1 3-octaprenyl-4-hydroxybenzoate carboxy-lyase [Legionella londiniensis]STX94240.1 3-octaprenyl-4-hydroxybenzoate carboxy-lyase [Legionella londiniensis]